MAVSFLKALDKAALQFYHYVAIVIAGMGLFTDAYSFFSIIPVTYLIGRIYYNPDKDGKPGTLPSPVLAAVVASVFAGSVVGQILFGFLGDRLGRRKVYGVQPSTKDTILPHPPSADLAWRIILMIGTIPAIMTLLIGSVVLLRSSKMTHKLDKYQDLPAEAMKHILIGLTLPPEHETAFAEAFNLAKFQAIFAITAIIPGYFAAIMTIDRVGRRQIQMLGFLLMTIVLLCMVLSYDTIQGNNHKIHFNYLFMYALIFFFANFGPNTTTFVLPAELFPARFRTTCHGIAGAAGKVGAIIGSIGLLWCSETGLDKNHKDLPGKGMKYILIGLTAVCFVGAVHTYFFTPKSTVAASLEDHED
ncbi:phosphate transporter 1 [Rhynchospora pubera]|uniref:H(+)/Pi cotransporter n=1 Tax=Rhynchospora pubera TaxID=906938 RepID=A0AAV8FKW5_9POAL|nr:phosphate transporter 1 [Rhynchospora pubera]